MTRTASTFRRIGLALTLALTVSAAASSASFAYDEAEARQQCTGDAFRLCSSEIPWVSKITACMIKNRKNLSPGCRAVMDKNDAAERKSSKTAATQG
jgi:hypothetical protein